MAKLFFALDIVKGIDVILLYKYSINLILQGLEHISMSRFCHLTFFLRTKKSNLMNENTLNVKSRDKLILIRLSFTPNINVFDVIKLLYKKCIFKSKYANPIYIKLIFNSTLTRSQITRVCY